MFTYMQFTAPTHIPVTCVPCNDTVIPNYPASVHHNSSFSALPEGLSRVTHFYCLYRAEAQVLV